MGKCGVKKLMVYGIVFLGIGSTTLLQSHALSSHIVQCPLKCPCYGHSPGSKLTTPSFKMANLNIQKPSKWMVFQLMSYAEHNKCPAFESGSTMVPPWSTVVGSTGWAPGPPMAGANKCWCSMPTSTRGASESTGTGPDLGDGRHHGSPLL